MSKVHLYDVNKRLNHTNDHASMKGKEVVEIHKNLFNKIARGHEVLHQYNLSPDALDKALLAIGAKYWINRGFKKRNVPNDGKPLYNMGVFAKLGISYRLLEIDFIDNAEDEAVYDQVFEKYCQEVAALLVAQPKEVMLVAGHGAGDPGAIGVNGRKEADAVRDVCRRIYEIANSLESANVPKQPESTNTEQQTKFNVGDTIAIQYPNGAYIADDVAKMYGIYQIKETAIAGGSFNWEQNGVPETFVDLVDANGNKRADSDKVHTKKGDYFVYNRNFRVAAITTDKGNGKLYLQLDGGLGSNYYFWAVVDRCKKV